MRAFFAIPLFTLILAPLVSDAPMPSSLEPPLLIIVAPFAVRTSSHQATTARSDLFTFSLSLYVLTTFMLAVPLARLRHSRWRHVPLRD